MKRSLFALCMVLAVGTGCEKSKSSGTPSGAPKGDEVTLLKQLPKGNMAVFGGTFSKFHEFMTGGLMDQMMGKIGMDAGAMKTWAECFGKHEVMMAGGVTGAMGNLKLTYVMKGITAAQVAECGKQASYPTTVDPDGKFVTVEMTSNFGTQKAGYLALANDIVMTQTVMAGATAQTADRAMLEAVQKELASGTAADDTALVAEMGKVDRTRAMWFVATTAGTMLADKVTKASGWMDAGKGLSLDVRVEVADAKLADEAEKAIPQAKEAADMLGPEVGSVIKALRFDRSGKTLHFAIDLSSDQLKALMSKMGSMMPGMGGM